MSTAYMETVLLPITDMDKLRPGTRCRCRNGKTVRYVGCCLPRRDDCYIFCPADGPPFRVYDDGGYVLDLNSPQDIQGRLTLRGRRWKSRYSLEYA